MQKIFLFIVFFTETVGKYGRPNEKSGRADETTSHKIATTNQIPPGRRQHAHLFSFYVSRHAGPTILLNHDSQKYFLHASSKWHRRHHCLVTASHVNSLVEVRSFYV